MNIFISTTLTLTIFCCQWTTENPKYRKNKTELSVPNGGPWGKWGKQQFCISDYAGNFELKISPAKKGIDNTGVNGIRLQCPGPQFITSSYSKWWGRWNGKISCPKGFLAAFSLRVQEYQGRGDDTALNNIKFKCSDGTILYGNGNDRGEFGPWSDTCPEPAYICGIQTKMEPNQFWGDDTTINDVKFFCCDD